MRDNYNFIKVIGHGSFGTVREAIRKSHSARNEKFAIKSIPVNKISSLTDLKIEIEILRTADHPNIIRFFETYEDSNYVHIVMEICSGGDFLTRISQQCKVSEHIVANYMYKICSAVNYLHSLKFCHRDLKPENFLMTSSDANAEVKIIDFGLATKFKGADTFHYIVGTPYYIAPEVLCKKYGKECDVWSLGVILFTIICGEPPFTGKNPEEIFEKILNEKVKFESPNWQYISKDCKSLIKKMMAKDPFLRIDMTRVLEHEWFTKFRQKNVSKVPVAVLDSILKYHPPNKLRQSLLKLVIRHMNLKQIQALSELFSAFDVNHTGKVSYRDIISLISKSKDEALTQKTKKILKKNCHLEDISLDYSDFILATLDKKQIFTDDLLHDVFYQLTNVIQIQDTLTSTNISYLQTSLLSAGIFFTKEEIEEFINQSLGIITDSLDYSTFREIIFLKSPSLFIDDSP